MSESFYDILGVSKTSKPEDIKRAYRSLSLKYHPDRNPSDKDAKFKFQKINEAYETLGNDEKRRNYDAPKNPFMDMFGVNLGGGKFGGVNLGGVNLGGSNGGSEMDDIFQVFFGGFPGPSVGQGFMFPPGFPPGFSQGVQFMQKPTPIVKTVTITLEQVLTGVNMPIDIDRWIMEGNNKTTEREILYITIPKGIDDGEIILISEKGNLISGTIGGDVKIFIKVDNQTEFQRNGLDLIVNKEISLKEALCGFNFELKYINGKIYSLNNSAGKIVQPGHKKIISNMGLTRDNHVGNLIIIFNVKFPEHLSTDQIAKINDLL